MSDSSGAAALALAEALIERLEAEGILASEGVEQIYDAALRNVWARGDVTSGTGEFHARLTKS
jgi:hypothetical protein